MASFDDIAAEEAAVQQAKGYANRAQAQGVSPDTAGQAIGTAPFSGVAPSVAMQDPVQLAAARAAQLQAQDDKSRAGNPAINRFEAVSPAHAAAASGSVPQLDALSKAFEVAKQTAIGAFTGLAGIMETPNSAEMQFGSEYSTPDIAEKMATVAPPTTAAGATARKYSPFLAGALFGPEADGKLLAQLGVRGANVLFPAGAATGAAAGAKALGGDQEVQDAAFSLGGLLGSFGVGAARGADARIQSVRDAFTQGKGPITGEGLPPVGVDGLHPTNAKGFVVDPNGTPYTFQDPMHAAIWAENTLHEGTGQKFSLFTVNLEDGKGGLEAGGPSDNPRSLTGIKVQNPLDVTGERPVGDGSEWVAEPESQPPAGSGSTEPTTTGTVKSPNDVVNETSISHLSNILEKIAATPMATQSPVAMQQFIKQQLGDAADNTVQVPAQALVDYFRPNELQNADINPSTMTAFADSGKSYGMDLVQYLSLLAGHPAAEHLLNATTFYEGGKSNDELALAKEQKPVEAPASVEKPLDRINKWVMMDQKPGGSQPGGIYHDENSDAWLVKGATKPNDLRARNEVTAANLMREAGIPHPEMKLVQLGDLHGGGLGVASKMMKLKAMNASDSVTRKQMQDQFAVHAWLGNRDVIGTGTEVGGSDNTAFETRYGNIVHFDPGGAGLFRAIGEPKNDFTWDAKEWDSLRDPKYPHSHAWFGDMTPEQLQQSAKHLLYLSDRKIEETVAAGGLPKSYADTLIARKYDILQKAGLDAPLYTAPIEPAETIDLSSMLEEPDQTKVTPADNSTIKTLYARVESAVDTLWQERGLDKLFFEPKAAELSKALFGRYADATQEQYEALVEKAFKKVLDRIQKEYKSQWDAAYAQHLAQATYESMQMPIIKAQFGMRFKQEQVETSLHKDNYFVGPDGKLMTFYHGSSHTSNIGTPENPMFKSQAYNVISFTTDPDFAINWGNIGPDNEGSFLYIVHLKAGLTEVGDYEKPADVERAANWFVDHAHYSKIAIAKSQLSEGSYPMWENTTMQKALGWTATYMKENRNSKSKNINVQSGDQVFFKYQLRPEQQLVFESKISTAEKANYPAELIAQLPQNIFSKKGLSADQVAGLHGLGSGEELLKQTAAIQQSLDGRSFRKWHMDQLKDEAHQRTLNSVGNLIDPERIQRDAEAVFDGPAVEDMLTTALKLFHEATGEPFNPGDIKAATLTEMKDMPIGQAMKLKSFEKDMWNASKAAENALLKNQPISAFKFRQNQLQAFYRVQQAHEYRKMFLDGMKEFRQLGRKEAFDSIEPNIAVLLQLQLKEMHLRTALDQDTLTRTRLAMPIQDIHTLVQSLNLMGESLDFAEVPWEFHAINEPVLTPKAFAKAMPAGTFEDLHNMIHALAKIGREWNSVIAGEERAELSYLGQQVEANAEYIGGGRDIQQLKDDRRSWIAKHAPNIQSLFAVNLRPEVILSYADKGEQGPITRFAVNGLMNGKFTETDLTDDWHNDLTNFKGAKSVHTSMSQKLTAPDSFTWVTPKGRLKWVENRGEMLMANLNLGTPLNRMKLFKGYGMPEAQWEAAEQWLLAQPTPAEVEFLERVRGQFNKLFPKSDAVYIEDRGYGLSKQPSRQLAYGDGRVSEGGYFPLNYDPELKDVAQLQFADGVASIPSAQASVLDSHPASYMPSNGFSKERTNFTGPLDLNYMKLANVAAELIHDISFRIPLKQAQKLLGNPLVQSSLQGLLGHEYSRQVMPWLKYIAQERMFYDPASAEAASNLQAITSNIAYSHIAWQSYSAIKHLLIATSHISGELKLDLPEMSQAFADLVGTGPKQVATRKWVQATFGEVRGVKYNWDFSLHDIMKQNPYGMNTLSNVKQMGLALFTYQKILEAHLVALVKYRQVMAQECDHETAVAIANQAVRNTLGAGHAVDAPAVFRGGGDTVLAALGNQLARFMTFENTGFNREWTSVQQMRLGARRAGRGDKVGAKKYTDSGIQGMIAFMLMPAALLALYAVYGQGKKDKKHPERSLAEQFGVNLVKDTAGSLIPLNDLMGTLEGFADDGIIGSYAANVGREIEHPLAGASLAHAIQVIGEPVGVPDGFSWEAQNIYDAIDPSRLTPESQTPVAWGRKVLLGEKPQYEPATAGYGFHPKGSK